MKTIPLLFTLLVSAVCMAQKIRIEDNKLTLAAPVLFKTGTAEILPESEETLKNIKAYLDEKTFITTLRIEGHVAGDNPTESQALSESRAMAIAKWLVKAGIDCKRLAAVGFGNTKPVVDKNSTDKALNTRTVFAVAALRGHLLGGMTADGGGKIAGDACQ